jgi:hypothetical protein
MTSPCLNSVQLQAAYRMAVQSSLIAFYQKSDSEAERLVERWWQRLSPSEDIQSGMFLHSEALATAADLAHMKEIPLTDTVRQRYRQILRTSTREALTNQRQEVHSTQPQPVKQSA